MGKKGGKVLEVTLRRLTVYRTTNTWRIHKKLKTLGINTCFPFSPAVITRSTSEGSDCPLWVSYSIPQNKTLWGRKGAKGSWKGNLLVLASWREAFQKSLVHWEDWLGHCWLLESLFSQEPSSQSCSWTVSYCIFFQILKAPRNPLDDLGNGNEMTQVGLSSFFLPILFLWLNWNKLE